MLDLGTLIYTWFFGVYQGKDSVGNRYYLKKNDPAVRWVVFKGGKPDPLSIPAPFHSWLHRVVDGFPLNEITPSVKELQSRPLATSQWERTTYSAWDPSQKKE